MLAEGPVAVGIAATGAAAVFDLDGNGTLNNEDVDVWLDLAAAQNGFATPYLRGDSNLDGAVDGNDFIAWNSEKFTSTLRWDHGDFDGDGTNNGADFIVWNQSKFRSSEFVLVPEPTTNHRLLMLMSLILGRCVLLPRCFSRVSHRNWEGASIRPSKLENGKSHGTLE